VLVHRIIRLALKVTGLALLAGSGYLAYNLPTVSFSGTPVIAGLTVFFIALIVVGSLLVLLFS